MLFWYRKLYFYKIFISRVETYISVVMHRISIFRIWPEPDLRKSGSAGPDLGKITTHI